MDIGSGGGVSSSTLLASDDRPVCHHTQLLPALSLLNDPMEAGTDAFLQSWDHLQAYAFPPFSLIRQVLSRLQSSWGTLLTLKEWYPDLLRLSVAPPVTLPSRPVLLRQPHIYRLHQNLPMLQLHEWRLSSALRDI